MPERDSDPPQDGLEPIAIVYSLPEAAVLVATLRAYGIFAVPRHQGHISVVPSLMVALDGVWITVPASQAEDAIALLEASDSGWRCPPTPFAEERWLSRVLSVGFAVLFGALPMPRARGAYSWRPSRPPTED